MKPLIARVVGMNLRIRNAVATEDSNTAIEEMIRQRAGARKTGDWSTADRLKAELGRLGVFVKDTRQGTRWYQEGKEDE